MDEEGFPSGGNGNSMCFFFMDLVTIDTFYEDHVA